MPATKVNLSQMVDLAVVTPRIGAVNSNVLHTLLHAMLRELNIVDVQADSDLNDNDMDFLSASKARELSVLSDIDSGGGDDTEDALRLSLSERSSSMPTPSTGKRTSYHQVANVQEELKNMTSVPSNEHLFKKARTPYNGKSITEMWLNILLFLVQTNEKGIDKCMSMIEDMAKEMQAHRNEDKMQLDQIKGKLFAYCHELQVNKADRTEVDVVTYCDELQVNKADRTEVDVVTYCDELQVNKADRTEVDVVTYCDELQVNKADRTEVDVVTYCDELQVDKADGTEVNVVTHCDELQVDKACRTEVDVVTYYDELQVDKADRTEVDVVTCRDELQVDKADRTEVDVVTCHDELQVDKADRTEVDVVTCHDELQVDKADRTEVDVVTYCDELQVDKADRIEVDVVTCHDELQIDKADRTEVDVVTHCDELQVNKADRTEVDVVTYCDELQVNKADRTEVDVVTYCDELQVNKADRTEVDVKADKRTLDNEVNHSLFDTKTNDIRKMIKKILNKMAVKDEAWYQKCKILSDDIDRKLDRLELKSLKEWMLGRLKSLLKEWLLRRLKTLNDQLNEQNQAPVRRLKALGDKLPTGDTSTRSRSNSLFDTETNDISKMIKEILNMIAVNEEAWNQQCKVFSDDIDKKLDRVEFKPLKEWLLRRLKALNDKLKKQNKGHVRRLKALNDKLKKQNQAHVRRLKALNDKLPTGPVPSSMPSVSSHQALHPTISPRPDLNFEMDQILPHAKSDTSTLSTVAEKQNSKTRKSGQNVFKFFSKMMLKPFRKAKSQ